MLNIPEERPYEKQLEGFNSAGWIVGHLCVEAEDVFNHLGIPYEMVDDHWTNLFKMGKGKIPKLEHLPSKDTLLDVFEDRYKQLSVIYENMTEGQKEAPHPSKFLKSI